MQLKTATPIRLFSCLLFFMAAAALLQGCSFDRAHKAYEKGERLLGDGDYSGAIAEYSSVVSGFPSSEWAPKSQYRIVFIFNHHIDDMNGAREAFARLLVLYPGSEEAFLGRQDMAQAWSRKGEHRKAIEEYQRLIMERPGTRRTFQYRIALEYVMMNEFRQARVELVDLLDAITNPALAPLVRYEIANTYYIEGNMNEAIKRYDEIMDTYPGHPVAVESRLGKAKALDEAGRLDEALDILTGLLGEYPNKEAIETRIRWIHKRLRSGPVGAKGAAWKG